MKEKIMLRFLLNGDTYRIVRELKSQGGKMNYRTLRRNLNIGRDKFCSAVTGLYPCISKEGENLSLSKHYDFMLVGNMGYAYYLRKRLKQRR